jgi:hypothetical protein
LNHQARGPTGCFGMSIIHQPSAICASTIAAISQCSTTAVRV